MMTIQQWDGSQWVERQVTETEVASRSEALRGRPALGTYPIAAPCTPARSCREDGCPVCDRSVANEVGE